MFFIIMHLSVNHVVKTTDHHYSLLQYIIILLSCYSVRANFRMRIACALINSLFWQFYTSKTLDLHNVQGSFTFVLP